MWWFSDSIAVDPAQHPPDSFLDSERTIWIITLTARGVQQPVDRAERFG